MRFRRRRNARAKRAAQPQVPEAEVTDYLASRPRRSFFDTLRGDAESGAGFGAGLFNELGAVFSAGKRVQQEEQESQRRRGHRLHATAPPRDDLASGIIRIRRSDSPAAEPSDAPAADDADDADDSS